MESYEKSVEILNDLLRINNDRVEGYLKAIQESPDGELKHLFADMADVSRKLGRSLTNEIVRRGGVADVRTTTSSGKIYRAWMDVKATFASDDRKSVLEACEFGEDAAQKAYKEALEDANGDLRDLISAQRSDLKECHDLIKARRDELKLA